MTTRNLILNIIFILLIGFICAISANAQETDTRMEGWFYADEHPEVIEAMGDHEFAAGLLEALADAGTNWTELWSAISSQQGILWSHACWLVINMPHLDRIEMTEDILLDHVRFAYATRTDLPYTTPQELFREFILAYRIGDEPVRMWRSNIWFEYDELVGATTAETASNINLWVSENLEVRERGFFGPRPDPLAVITAGTGTESDIAGVAIAMCKTFGVPARRARIEVLGEVGGGRTWLEIWSDGEWIPMYPDNPDAFGDRRLIERDHPHNVTVVSTTAAFTETQVTSAYTDTGTMNLQFIRNGDPVADFEHFTVSAWNSGAWLPLDDIWTEPESGAESETETGPDKFTVVLGDGFYIVQVGVRNSRGDAYVQTKPVMINPGSVTEISFTLDIPPSMSESVDLVSRTIDPLPELNLDYANAANVPVLFPENLESGKYTCVLIFDGSQEPSIRMVPMVLGWAVNSGADVIAVGLGDSVVTGNLISENSGDNQSVSFYTDPDRTIAQAFGISPNDEGVYANLPLVTLLTPEGEIIYLEAGYNLSVADRLARAVELDGMQ